MQKESTPNISGTASVVTLSSGIRLIGVLVLLAGVAVAYQVVETAWSLFDDQKRVLLLSEQIEEATHINATVNDVIDVTKLMRLVAPSQELSQEDVPLNDEGTSNKPKELNLTYFVAWIIVFLLLGLIGRVAYWFIQAGGKVALYGTDQGTQLTTALKQVLLEVHRSKA